MTDYEGGGTFFRAIGAALETRRTRATRDSSQAGSSTRGSPSRETRGTSSCSSRDLRTTAPVGPRRGRREGLVHSWARPREDLEDQRQTPRACQVPCESFESNFLGVHSDSPNRHELHDHERVSRFLKSKHKGTSSIKNGSVDLGYHTSCHTRYALGSHIITLF